MKQSFTRKSILLALFATFFGITSSLAQITKITTGTLDPTTVCEGGSVTVPFEATGTALPTTIFVAQLSDAAGTFGATPTEIGSGTASPINATVPAGTAAGSAYKIRVISRLALVLQTEGSESGPLKVNAIPAAPTATSPVTYEQGKDAKALEATGTGLKWYDDPSGGTGNPAAPIPLTTTPGTKSFYVSQTIGGCESPRTKVDVTVTPCTPPAKPTVADVSYEVGKPADVLSAQPAGGLLWYDTAQGGTGTATAPVPSTAAVGTKSYFVSRTVNGCESERAEIKVTVSACATAAPGVANKTYNVGDKADALTATGTGLKWYTAANGGTGSATAPTPTTTSPGEQRFYVSQTPSGGCEGPRAEIVVTVNCATPKPIVENKSYTVGQDAPELEAAGTAVKWYTNETGGTGSTTAPKPSTTTAGSTTYYATQTLNNCESERAAIVVTVSACATPAPTVANKNYNVGEKADALTAVGSGLKWYTAANGGTGSSTAPTPTTTAPGEQRFYVSQTPSGGCEGPRAEIVVTVTCATPKPTVENKSYTIGQNAPVLEATGTGLKWYTNESGGTGSATAPKPSTTTAGSTTYYVTQTLNNCESERAAIVVTVSACATPAPTVANKSYKVGDKADALTAGGTGLKWYTSATGGTGSATAPTPTTTAPGEQRFYVSQTPAGGCEGPRAEIVVTVTCATPKPIVENKSYTIGQNAPVLEATGTGLKWYTSESGGTGSATAPKPSTTTAGSTTYYVTQTLNNCESERAAIVVTVSACATPAPTVANKNYKVGDKADALTAGGTGLKWYSSATGGTGSATAPTPTTTAPGEQRFYVSQTAAGGCEGPRAEIVVTVTCATPKPTVENKSYFIGQNAPVLEATGTGLKWYTSETGGTGSTTAPKPSTATVGSTTYYVTQTLNNCESERAPIVVTITACPPIANIPLPAVVTPLNICQGPTAAALTATATNGTYTLKWYTTANGGTGSATLIPNATNAGTTSYYVSQTTAAGCESARVKIDVIVKDTPIAPTVANVPYCVGATATALSPSGGLYKWYTSATGGTGTPTGPIPSTTTPGTTSYYLTQSNTYPINGATLSCESPRSKVDVTVNARPGAVAPLSEAFCQEKADKSYAFPTKADGTNTLNWYTAATGGTPVTQVPAINLKTAGETTYFVTQKSAAGCESTTRVAQKVRVKPLPALPTIEKPLIEYCQFIAADPLQATPVTNGILNWYGTDPASTPSATAPTPSTAEGGTTSYFVGQTLEGCVGDAAKIDVKINTTPKPTTTTSLAYCQNEVAPPLSATGTVLKWYRDADGKEWQGVPFTPFTARVQDYSFYVTQTGSNGCESPKEEIKIHIKSLPSATISGNSTIDLGDTGFVTIKFTGDGPWTYVLSNGDTATTNQSTHQVQVKPSTTTTYLLTEIRNACGKGTPGGSAVVTVRVPTINSGNPSVAEACASKTFSVPFQQSGDFPSGNTFKLQISRVNQDASFYTVPSVASGNTVTATIPDTTAGGSYFVRVINSGANADFLVKGSVSAITINIVALPVATISGAQTILVGANAALKVETTGKGPWTLTLNNGTKDSLINAAVSPYTFNVSPKTTTTYTITKVTNGCGTGKGTGSARVQVDPILGVEPSAPAEWVKIFPTLVQSKVTVELETSISTGDAVIQVIDLNGHARTKQPIREKITEVDFQNLPSGLYLLNVKNGKLNTVQRILKP